MSGSEGVLKAGWWVACSGCQMLEHECITGGVDVRHFTSGSTSGSGVKLQKHVHLQVAACTVGCRRSQAFLQGLT
nr:hypothetical protein [Candidatus Bathyarchaeota archaeon]